MISSASFLIFLLCFLTSMLLDSCIWAHCALGFLLDLLFTVGTYRKCCVFPLLVFVVYTAITSVEATNTVTQNHQLLQSQGV